MGNCSRKQARKQVLASDQALEDILTACRKGDEKQLRASLATVEAHLKKLQKREDKRREKQEKRRNKRDKGAARGQAYTENLALAWNGGRLDDEERKEAVANRHGRTFKKPASTSNDGDATINALLQLADQLPGAQTQQPSQGGKNTRRATRQSTSQRPSTGQLPSRLGGGDTYFQRINKHFDAKQEAEIKREEERRRAEMRGEYIPPERKQRNRQLMGPMAHALCAFVNSRGANEETPLIAASRHGHLPLVRILVEEYMADIDQFSALADWSPLQAACYNGHKHVVRYLCGCTDFRRVDVNIQNNAGLTPLHMCLVGDGSLTCAEILVAQPGIDANRRDLNGETALYAACKTGDVTTAYLLLKSGADPNLEDTNGRTPFFWVVSQDRIMLSLVELLVMYGADYRNWRVYAQKPRGYAARIQDSIERGLKDRKRMQQ